MRWLLAVMLLTLGCGRPFETVWFSEYVTICRTVAVPGAPLVCGHYRCEYRFRSDGTREWRNCEEVP